MKYTSSTIKSKWTKTKWLLRSTHIRSYIPRTLVFSRSNLKLMLSQYSTVFFKPTTGTGGFQIFRITKIGSGGYLTQHNTNKKKHASFDALYEYLKRHAQKRGYLLQKGIRLATTKGRSFDIRVMVQKSNNGRWKSTGVFTKIGKPGKVATNYHQGGRLGLFQQTLSGAGYTKARIISKQAELERLGVSVGRVFDKNGNGFRELGLDVALDNQGKAWILEVNTRPAIYPLKQINNRALYSRIIGYARQYGRRK